MIQSKLKDGRASERFSWQTSNLSWLLSAFCSSCTELLLFQICWSTTWHGWVGKRLSSHGLAVIKLAQSTVMGGGRRRKACEVLKKKRERGGAGRMKGRFGVQLGIGREASLVRCKWTVCSGFHRILVSQAWRETQPQQQQQVRTSSYNPFALSAAHQVLIGTLSPNWINWSQRRATQKHSHSWNFIALYSSSPMTKNTQHTQKTDTKIEAIDQHRWIKLE